MEQEAAGGACKPGGVCEVYLMVLGKYLIDEYAGGVCPAAVLADECMEHAGASEHGIGAEASATLGAEV